MIRWRLYDPYPVDAAGRKVTDNDGKPDWAAETVAGIRLRWRVTGFGSARSATFPATRDGRAELKALQAHLHAAARNHWPADDRGRPKSPTEQAAAGESPPPAPTSPAAGAPPHGASSSTSAAPVAEVWTVEEWIDHWLATVLPMMDAANTKQHYDTPLGIAKRLLRLPAGDSRGPAGASIRLDQLSTDDLQRAVNERISYDFRTGRRGSVEEPAVGLRTEEVFVQALTRCLREARERVPPLLTDDPMRGVVCRTKRASRAGRRRSQRAGRQQALALAEVLRVLPHLDDHWHAMVLIRLTQASRISEIRHTDVADIDLDQRTVTYRRATPQVARKHNNGSQWETRRLKHRDEGEVRIVPIPDWPELLDLLDNHLERMRELHRQRDRELAGELERARAKGNDQLVAQTQRELAEHRRLVRAFPSLEGAPFDSSDFNKRHWHPAVSEAFADEPDHPLVGVPFNDVRHAGINDWQDYAGLTPLEAAETDARIRSAIDQRFKNVSLTPEAPAEDSDADGDNGAVVIDLAAYRQPSAPPAG